MTRIASRELRNDTRGVLRRVEAGEDVVITVDGRPVAELRPLAGGPRWMARGDFLRLVEGREADATVADERA